MKILKIPVYAYYSGFSYPTFLKLILDDTLYQKYLDGPTGQVWRAEDITDYNPCASINEVLGAQLLGANEITCFYERDQRLALDTYWSGEVSRIQSYFNKAGVWATLMERVAGNVIPTKVVAMNGQEFSYWSGNFGQIAVNVNRHIISRAYPQNPTCEIQAYFDETQIYMRQIFMIYPEDFIMGDNINEKYNRDTPCPSIQCYMRWDRTGSYVDLEAINVSHRTVQTVYLMLKDFNINDMQPNWRDVDNPYSKDGNSEAGGGDGTLTAEGLNSVQPTAVPGLPAISATDLGFITIYNPTASQMKQLANFMWSNLFDLNTYKKLFSDPMQSIIGLGIVPVAPSIGGSKNVTFGTIDSGINMQYLSSQWVQVDCGSVSVEKFVGCFMDADPYTKIQIFLPAIGFRQLSADDINGGTIRVVYNVDCLTGGCAAFIEHDTRGVLYSYNGSMICNVPLTSINFSEAIQNAVSAVISGVGMAAGMATGAAPLTAMSAAGLMNSAANTALNSKPSVQRSGNMGGAAGIMGVLKPYIIIERPDMSVPYDVEHYAGQASNLNINLGACKGFTMCEYVHVENVAGTSDEIREIEQLLKEGVYL